MLVSDEACNLSPPQCRLRRRRSDETVRHWQCRWTLPTSHRLVLHLLVPRRRHSNVHVCLQLRQGEGAAKRSANALLRRGDRNRPVVRTEGDGVCRSSTVLEPNSRWVACPIGRILSLYGRVQPGGVPLRPGRPLPQRVLRQPRPTGERAGRLLRRERTVTCARPSVVSELLAINEQTHYMYHRQGARLACLPQLHRRPRRWATETAAVRRRRSWSACACVAVWRASCARCCRASGRAARRARARRRTRRPCPHAGAAHFSELGKRTARRRCTLPPQRFDVCAARIFLRRHWRAAASAAAASERRSRAAAARPPRRHCAWQNVALEREPGTSGFGGGFKSYASTRTGGVAEKGSRNSTAVEIRLRTSKTRREV